MDDSNGAGGTGEAEARLVAAALDLAATQGWPAVTVTAAAEAADIAPLDAFALVGTKRGLLAALGRHLDRAVAEDGPGEAGDSVRDRLFDLIMRRFDALMAHRPGVLAVMRSLPGDPITAFCQALAVEASMRQTLDLAGVASDGLVGELKVRGLTLIFLLALHSWTRDDSEDMAATMATLDRRLQQGEQVATLLDRRRRTERSAEDAAETGGSAGAAGDPEESGEEADA